MNDELRELIRLRALKAFCKDSITSNQFSDALSNYDTDPTPSILDVEFPETVWDWGACTVVDITSLPDNSAIVYPSFEVALAAGAPNPAEITFENAINDAFSDGYDWLVITDENDNEIARYPTR